MIGSSMDTTPHTTGDIMTPANDKQAKLAKKAEVKAARAAAKAEAKAERAAQKAKVKAEKEHAKSLAEMAEAKLLKQLSSSLKTHARSATFACGGSVSIKTGSAGQVPTEQGVGTQGNVAAKESTEKSDRTGGGGGDETMTPIDNATTIDPVQVRFGQSGKGLTVLFTDGGISETDLDYLTSACQPASFGFDGKAVLDEEYRKASKLDKSEFATSFCPYEAGIIDVITQLLVPQSKHDKHHRSVRAELYKLNVYSAPSGKFKGHVDTRRSKDQVGSLVVALPSDHQGGQLAVRNAGQETIFDWSNVDGITPNTIEWAAFYNDCEHEVYEVTSGHRVTLTYNLFLTRGAGHLAGAAPVLDATQLPLYDNLQQALDNPGFVRRGRVLAVWLTHSYAHTSKHLNFLPESLKGADMSLWNTAQSLGLKCITVPIMSQPDYDDGVTHVFEPRFLGFNQGGSGSSSLDEYGPYWGHQMPESKITWLNASEESHGRKKSDGKDKTAKTELKFKEVQMAYMTYGNEPGIGIDYSRAAMLIRIPPFDERLSGAPAPASVWEGVKRDSNYYDDDEDYDEYDEYDEEGYSSASEESFEEGGSEDDDELEDDDDELEAGNGDAVMQED